MKLNKTKNTVQGAFWGIFEKIVSLLFPFVIRTIIIRTLGSEYTGLGNLFSSMLQVFSLADLGIGSAVVFSMYKAVSEEDKKTLSALLNFFRKAYFVIGAVIVSIGLLIIPFLRFFIKGDLSVDINIYVLYLLYLFDTSASYMLFSYRSSLMSAHQREADNSRIRLICKTIMYCLQMLVLIKFKDYYIYTILLPLFTVISNFSKYIYSKIKYPDINCSGKISKEYSKEIRTNVSALLMHKIGGVTINTFDNIVISSFMGLVLLSNYNNYYYLINAVFYMLIIVFNSMTAGIGNSIITEAKEKVVKDFYIVLYLNGAIVSVCTVCFFSMFQDFIFLWVGKSGLFDFYVVILLCMQFFVHTIRRTILTYRDAAGMWKDNKWQPIVSSVFNIILNIILIQKIGLSGVIISTILAMAFIDIPWESKALMKGLLNEKLKNYIGRIIFYGMLTVVSCLICYFVLNNVIIQNKILKLIFDFFVAVFVGGTVFIIPTVKTKEFKNAKRKILNIIGK